MSTYLKRIKELILGNAKDIVIFGLLFLVSSISFALGYLMNKEFERAPIIIEKCSDASIR